MSFIVLISIIFRRTKVVPINDWLKFTCIVFTSVSDPDPFHFGQADPFHETDPGSKNISENHGKFSQKSASHNHLHFFQNM